MTQAMAYRREHRLTQAWDLLRINLFAELHKGMSLQTIHFH